ncbi:DNA-binding protein [Flavisolibacter sp. BT320]|nr:DNA-binding protein [Flavisolibacter longurius]
MRGLRGILLVCLLSLSSVLLYAQVPKNVWTKPTEDAKPWVIWYWMHGAISKEGITADIKAMKAGGIGGAYLMTVKDTTKPSIYQPVARQLTPLWWTMIKHAMAEAKRYDVKLALHISDGFALAGGPWIKPEASMQKLVWTQTYVKGGKAFNDTLAQPETLENYYRDVAVFAFPSLKGTGVSTATTKPVVTTNSGADASFLTNPANTKNFVSEDSCWIQYSFEQPFTLRSLVIRSRINYVSNRLIVEWSNDGKSFTRHTRLESPRVGWQDWDSDYTHAIPEITAKHFRFIYTKEGAEPGAEDLDAAKWRPVLKITGIELSSEPRIHQYEGKNGEVWRLAKRTTEEQNQPGLFVPKKEIIDITKYLDANGKLNWIVPAGDWTIIRIGHTSTGHKNETAGGGKGLECDKFSKDAVTLQFNSWFGELMRQGGATAEEIVKLFHIDSWECGSQNWSQNFREEFKKRRGYDLYPYLPVMGGIPVESNQVSEGFLYDVRKTIAELFHDNFFGTLRDLTKKEGVKFVAESVAPTMMSDGMLHYSKVDYPMGEFWLRSPTHDKPNDMLDAISGAHVYGKNIVQAEAFTQLRMAFDEHPGNLKALLDRNFALGINRMVFHVFMHNPWLAKKPGITLDAIGLLFQRDQTWWPKVDAFTAYVKRCQALLQLGKPVTDIAVFTGEELPRRSLLPERLVPTLPGLFGKEAVEREAARLRNAGQPTRKPENGVTYVGNTTDAQSWTDPLRGYAYDSFNPDALLNLSSVKGKEISLSTGAKYKILVVPDMHKLLPDSGSLSSEAAKKILALAKEGATVLLANDGRRPLGLKDDRSELQKIFAGVRSNSSAQGIGKGKILTGPFEKQSLAGLGIAPDFLATDEKGERADSLAWTHRAGKGFDIYFVSNQAARAKELTLSLRLTGKQPELWDAVTGSILQVKNWKVEGGRTVLPVRLEGSGSLFVVLQKTAAGKGEKKGTNWITTTQVQTLNGDWKVSFDSSLGGPKGEVVFTALQDWSQHQDTAIRYYSGTAVYRKTFSWKKIGKAKAVYLHLGNVANMAEVFVNGISYGTVWIAPYRIDISKALKGGRNELKIEVVNTWANRMIGDARQPLEKRISSTVYPFKMEGKPLLPAGLLGPVRVEVIN